MNYFKLFIFLMTFSFSYSSEEIESEDYEESVESELSPYIIRGKKAKLGQFTAAVAVDKGTTMGTIISKDWVLTCAHYMKDLKKKPEDVILYAGMIDIKMPLQERIASKLIAHSQYKWLSNDIGLIKVKKSWILDIQYVNTALLGSFDPHPGLAVYLPGFGNNEDGKKMEFMTYNKIKTTKNDQCTKIMAEHGVLPESALCLKQNQNGACMGDSGTGYYFGDLAQKMVVGVQSYSLQTEKHKCLDDAVNGGSNVNYFRNWIEETMMKN